MKRVLITGATGFLGKYTVEEFRDHRYAVIATGRNDQNLRKLAGKNTQTILSSLEDLAKLDQPVDVVIHVAALSTVWGSWREFYDNNVMGTQHVIDFCIRNKVKRLVFVSSPSVYSGRGDRFDIKESEYDTNNNLNDYIKSKLLAEQLVKKANSQTLQTVILRPRGLFGVGDTSIVPRLIKANGTIGLPLFNDGKNLVDMTCVENVAYATRLAAESSRASGRTYNITNGEPREFRAIIDALFRDIGIDARYRHLSLNALYVLAVMIERVYKLFRIHREPPITRYTVCTLGYSQTLDISKARRDLGYIPKVSLDEGIKHYAEVYKESHS
jgi:nucleoside-diphosphate-sugar epimerase